VSKEKTLAKKMEEKISEDNMGGAKLKTKPKHKRCHGSLSGTVQRIVSEATTEAMGSTFQAIIISFHLKQKFGKDPYDVLIGDPEAFYNGLREILGTGADTVLILVGTLLSKRYGSSRSAEEFLALFTRGDSRSKHELEEIFRRIADQPRERERAMQTASDCQWLTSLKLPTM
jgi:hypothetical protein